MHRRQFLRLSALTVGAIPLARHYTFAQPLQQPWNIRMLRRNVGIFTEKGGTIAFLLSKEGTIVVDTQFPEQAAHLLGAFKERGGSSIDLLINTHHHADHTSGNLTLKETSKHLLAHSNSKLNQEKQAKARNTENAQWYPDQTFSDKWCQDIGKESICMHYFGPAHTNGDSLVHFEKANVVHMGDLLFNRIYPNVDKTSGASIQNWMLVLDRAYNVFNKKSIFVCGHGHEADAVTVDREFLREMKFFFENLLDFVNRQIKAGKTRDEITALTEIPGMEAWKDKNGFARVNLAAAYDELTMRE